MKFVYPAIIHNDSDGMWAEFVDLIGCTTYGEDLQDTLMNAAEAMELFVVHTLESGKALPVASDMRTVALPDENCFATLVTADVDLAKNVKSVKKTLTIPSWLNEKALEEGINFSQTLQEALVRKLIS